MVGQQGMQATPDILLGWTRGPSGRDFYLRQLWDMKGSVDITTIEPVGLGFYGGICGWSLARAHAVTGDAVAIASYLGTSDKFDGAIADFSETYAAVNERDHAAYVAAIKAGKVSVPAVSVTHLPARAACRWPRVRAKGSVRETIDDMNGILDHAPLARGWRGSETCSSGSTSTVATSRLSPSGGPRPTRVFTGRIPYASGSGGREPAVY